MSTINKFGIVLGSPKVFLFVSLILVFVVLFPFFPSGIYYSVAFAAFLTFSSKSSRLRKHKLSFGFSRIY